MGKLLCEKQPGQWQWRRRRRRQQWKKRWLINRWERWYPEWADEYESYTIEWCDAQHTKVSNPIFNNNNNKHWNGCQTCGYEYQTKHWKINSNESPGNRNASTGQTFIWFQAFALHRFHHKWMCCDANDSNAKWWILWATKNVICYSTLIWESNWSHRRFFRWRNKFSGSRKNHKHMQSNGLNWLMNEFVAFNEWQRANKR